MFIIHDLLADEIKTFTNRDDENLVKRAEYE